MVEKEFSELDLDLKCQMIIVMFKIIPRKSKPVEIMIQECLQICITAAKGKKFFEKELLTIPLVEIEKLDSNYIENDKDSLNIIVKEMELNDPGLYKRFLCRLKLITFDWMRYQVFFISPNQNVLKSYNPVLIKIQRKISAEQ